MSIFTRLRNRLLPRHLERDLRDEIKFHLEMRTNRHLEGGMSPDEATERAHQQFGDINAVTRQMRQARMSSVAAVVAVTSFVVGFALLCVVLQQMGSPDLRVPEPPQAPVVLDIDQLSDTTPPPPPPPPTCEEYVAKVKALQINPRSAFDRCGTSK